MNSVQFQRQGREVLGSVYRSTHVASILFSLLLLVVQSVWDCEWGHLWASEHTCYKENHRALPSLYVLPYQLKHSIHLPNPVLQGCSWIVSHTFPSIFGLYSPVPRSSIIVNLCKLKHIHLTKERGEKGGREGAVEGERERDPKGKLAKGGLLRNIRLVSSVFKGSKICRTLWASHLDFMWYMFHALISDFKPRVGFGFIICFAFQGHPCLGFALWLLYKTHRLISVPHTQSLPEDPVHSTHTPAHHQSEMGERRCMLHEQEKGCLGKYQQGSNWPGNT